VLDGEYVSNAMAVADVVAGRAYHKQMQQEAVRRRGSEQEPTPSPTSFMVCSAALQLPRESGSSAAHPL
jgi:hypothetical protein